MLAGCASDSDKSWRLPSVSWPKWSNPFSRGSATETPALAPSQTEPAAAPATDQPKPPPPPQTSSVPGVGAGSRAATASAVYVQQLSIGTELEQVGKLESAQAHYLTMVAQSPERFEAYQRLGRMAGARRAYQEAEGFYAQALQIAPQNPDLLADLGLCYLEQGKNEQAERALLKATAINPNQPAYHTMLVKVYQQQGRGDAGLDQFRMGREGDGRTPLVARTAKGEASGIVIRQPTAAEAAAMSAAQHSTAGVPGDTYLAAPQTR